MSYLGKLKVNIYERRNKNGNNKNMESCKKTRSCYGLCN